jgi:outer membrane protein OmpA-like peptidoglycan-associated protein
LASISTEYLSQKTGETIDDYSKRLKTLFNNTADEPKEFQMTLPLTIHGYIDRKLKDNFYVNAFANIPLVKTSKASLANRYLYSFAVTPRFETKNITIALPVSYNELKQVNAGIAFRGGPFFIGSGSIITNLFSSSVSHANVYAGIAIGIKRNKKAPEIIETTPPMEIDKKEEIKRIEFSAKNVYFESDRTSLLGYSYEVLDTLANFLNNNPTTRLVIEGHTDSTGSKENNLLLSQSRADAVVAYLKEKGISESRLIAIGQGTNKPLYDNTTPEGRAKNRRVEFKIITDADKPPVKKTKNK